uniref:Uncharacterized protein n=1 Tax=Knipowitschia caucasica TaxID=637954 RepID=A0AAV2JPN2_KNICA
MLPHPSDGEETEDSSTAPLMCEEVLEDESAFAMPEGEGPGDNAASDPVQRLSTHPIDHTEATPRRAQRPLDDSPGHWTVDDGTHYMSQV